MASEEPLGDHRDGPSSSRTSPLVLRLKYGVLVLLTFAVSLILRARFALDAGKVMHFGYHKQCGGSDQCLRDQPCYRLSCALVLFFLVHAILSSKYNCLMPSSHTRVAFNDSLYIVRFIVYIALSLGMLYIPSNGLFLVFAWFALIFAFVYIIGQLVIFIGFAYDLNEYLGSREGKCGSVVLIGATALLFIGSITGISFLYYYFGNHQGCQSGQAIITITLIGAFGYTILSVFAPRGSLFPSGILFTYTTYLAYSALASGIDPNSVCNGLSSGQTTWQLSVSSCLAGLSLVYACSSGGTSRGTFTGGVAEDGGNATFGAAGDDEEGESMKANHLSFFHVFMLLGSFYLAMLTTSWSITGGTGSDSSNGDVSVVDSGVPSMWIKFSSSLTCIILYCWSLVAPWILKDRVFD